MNKLSAKIANHFENHLPTYIVGTAVATGVASIVVYNKFATQQASTYSAFLDRVAGEVPEAFANALAQQIAKK